MNLTADNKIKYNAQYELLLHDFNTFYLSMIFMN